jgi:hypothetical protein
MLAPNPNRTTVLRAGAALLALAAWGAAPAARADNIDEMLLTKARSVAEQLHTQGYHNIGVLPFRVEKGTKPYAGRLNALLATRLENALILREDDDKNEEDKRAPLGVTRGAGAVATAHGLQPTQLDAAGRRRLFQYDYPLAWGKQAVKVDAFLTGHLKVDPKGGKTTVVLQAFDRDNVQPRMVLTFTVPVDRAVLTDLNQRWAVRKRSLDKGVDEKQLNETAVANAFGGAKAEEKVEGAEPADEDVDQLLDFQVFYNGKRVRPNAAGKVPSPRTGDRVHFVLRNKSKERIGLVLRVNGINTLGYEKDPREPADYSLWVLDPGRKYQIDGFYPTGRKMKPFRVVDPGKATAQELADESRLGQIDLDVFREGAGGAADLRLTSLRGDDDPVADRARLRGKLRTAAGRRIRAKGIILADQVRESPEIAEVPFHGRWAAHLTISYFQRPAAKDGEP